MERMEIPTSNIERNGQYAFMRLGFIVFLLISPLLPYVITMAFNSLLLVTLPAQIKSLPVYPGTKLEKEFLRQDTESNRCLELNIQYGPKDPNAGVSDFYKSALLASGWHIVSDHFDRYEKSVMNLDVDDLGRRIRLSITVDVFPVFQPGCLP